MTYYPTLAEDIKRAKEILERGREQSVFATEIYAHLEDGGITGGDNYAAFKLLESFVQELERVLPVDPND